MKQILALILLCASGCSPEMKEALGRGIAQGLANAGRSTQQQSYAYQPAYQPRRMYPVIGPDGQSAYCTDYGYMVHCF